MRGLSNRRRDRFGPRGAVLATAGLVVSLASGCSEGRFLVDATRYDRATLSAALDDPTSDAGFVVGEFALSANGVVDGDTIKVDGLDSSLRLLALDTEETFKHEDELRAYEAMAFPEYLESMRGTSGRPPKGPTPLGTDAKHFAQAFFDGVTIVRLERDHPKEIRGRFNRYLTYVFAKKGDEWVNYNVACVRAGMSPYFTKYGYSRRFHNEFSRAQKEARAAKLGIWEDGTEHYDDYDDRLAWWNSRAEFAAKFEEAGAGRNDHIVLTNWDAMKRLQDMRGEFVHVLAVVGAVRPRKGRAPARITLSRRLGQDFPVISFDDEVVSASGLDKSAGEYVAIEGRVARYTYKSRSKRKTPQSQLQIELKSADQVHVSPGWTAVAAARTARASEAPAAAAATPAKAQADLAEVPGGVIDATASDKIPTDETGPAAPSPLPAPADGDPASVPAAPPSPPPAP